MTPETVAALVVKYGPVILALIQLLEQQKDDARRAQSMADLSVGFQLASETGDTSFLETALRTHCAGM